MAFKTKEAGFQLPAGANAGKNMKNFKNMSRNGSGDISNNDIVMAN